MSRWRIGLAMLMACGGAQGDSGPSAEGSADWMAGVWRMDQSGGGLFEVWGRDEGGGLVGLNVSVDEHGTPSSPELMWIEPGAQALVAMPGGGRTRFVRSAWGDASATFSAPEHDSPKWVRYRRSVATLEAAIGDDAEPSASWRFEPMPGQPMVHRTQVEVCRDGDTMRVTESGCFCASRVTCGVVDDPIALRTAVMDNSCDACEPAIGECPYESTVSVADGECATRQAISLLIADLR